MSEAKEKFFSALTELEKIMLCQSSKAPDEKDMSPEARAQRQRARSQKAEAQSAKMEAMRALEDRYVPYGLYLKQSESGVWVPTDKKHPFRNHYRGNHYE